MCLRSTALVMSVKNISTDIRSKVVHSEIGKDVRKSAAEMDEQRQKTLAYEYLCHLEEAKKWMEACLGEKLPATTELEENLRNGIYLAKLGHFMAPEILPYNKIYDVEQKRFATAGLQYRHTDNINHFLRCLKSMQLPLTFQPETTDIYDKKNMPRVIYCIHALSTHLFKLGKAPQIQDLYGKVSFTDEEINTVSKELQKFGIQMPPFQRIGGLLTVSLAENTATLHAAVIAINQAAMERDRRTVLRALQDKSAQIRNVVPSWIERYCESLSRAKAAKAEAALNRSLNDSYIPDAYDELLTQAEIQGHINYVNARCALEDIAKACQDFDGDLISTLQTPVLQLHHVLPENIQLYREQLVDLVRYLKWDDEYFESVHCWEQKLQKAVNAANEIAHNYNKRREIVSLLNLSLQADAREEFRKILLQPEFDLRVYVDEFAIPLYYEEMKIDRIESQKDVSYSDVLVSFRVLSSIASITKAIDTGNPDLIYEALKNPDCHVSGLDEENKVKYWQALAAIRDEKRETNQDCPLLTYIDIQESIDFVNRQCHDDNQMIQVLRQINTAVMEDNRSDVVAAMMVMARRLRQDISTDDASLYLKLLRNRLNEKRSDGAELWLEDVENVADVVAAEADQVHAICDLLTNINVGVQQGDEALAVDALQTAGFVIPDELRSKCFRELTQLRSSKSDCHGPYVRYVTKNGNEAYLDLEKHSYTWDRPPETNSETFYITKGDIDEIVLTLTANKYASPSDGIRDEAIVSLQAKIRGYLVRKRLLDRDAHFRANERRIAQIQAWWRGVLQRRVYAKLIADIEKQGAPSERNTKHEDVAQRYKEQEDKVVKIQSLWRGLVARKAFRSLLRLEKPPFPVVRYFSGILNFNAEDYDRDLQLQHLKHEVVQSIRHNQNLSQQLDSMDIKIGLLIQNRITLQDVVAHGKSLESLAKQKQLGKDKSFLGESSTMQRGLKSLTKEGRKMLEGYQHLFYALQTNPAYLSKLLFLLPQSKTNKFLQNVILTLFNFGSNSREEYLLLKLFGSALQEEIRCKFQKPAEVVTGNPLVLKMVVNYARQLNGQRALRQIVGPIIEKILCDRSLSIETNPVDIYKCWRNQLEMESGESLDLPYTVTQQEALSYEYVREKLETGISLLRSTVLEFLDKITSSRNLIPYGMLYMAKVLNDSLRDKFPQAPEKDILKVVGNLIYYHFINAAIVAPDAFDIVTLPVDRTLSNDQRRNLASIAKILQFAASKKGFGEEATHLVPLNPFIINCHEKFKSFFRHCCQVENLDEHFEIHEYTEAILIEKPEIYISLQEICDTHSLMLEYQSQIAPDPMDPLHDLLDDLGPAPTIGSLLGTRPDTICESNQARFGKTEICLVLTNKFQVPDNEDTNLNKLFIKTKELLVSVLQFLKGQTLVAALEATCSPIQEKAHDMKLSSASSAFNVIHTSSSLNDCKRQLRAYLHRLELGGWVTQRDGYQAIITAVAKDLCNKSKYRVIRKKELQTLRMTKLRLEEKSKYYQEQVEFYNEYIQRCLENLHAGKGSLRALKAMRKSGHGRLRTRVTLRYTAAKLQEKGVLIEVDGLPHSQFKNVVFEITPAEHTGLFSVRCKFMGVEMEKVDIDIQKLLELQFEGSPIMDMFGKAKINVNLLLYLLNRKFYGKT